VWVRGEVGEERGVCGGGEDVGHAWLAAGLGWAGGGGQWWAKLEDERVTKRREGEVEASPRPPRRARARTLRRELGGARSRAKGGPRRRRARTGRCSVRVSLVTPIAFRAAHATMRCEGKRLASLSRCARILAASSGRREVRAAATVQRLSLRPEISMARARRKFSRGRRRRRAEAAGASLSIESARVTLLAPSPSPSPSPPPPPR
jgi:hypothetical protein